MSDVPAIPPLATISDESIKKVLKPLLDGWAIRNDGTGDDSKRFVTVKDLSDGQTMSVSGAGGIGAGVSESLKSREIKDDTGKVIGYTPATQGQVTKASPGAVAFANVLGSLGTSSAAQRLDTIESPEWFKENLAHYGTAAPSSSATYSGGSVAGAFSAFMSTTAQGSSSFISGLDTQYGGAQERTVEVSGVSGKSAFILGEVKAVRSGSYLERNFVQETLVAKDTLGNLIDKTVWVHSGGDYAGGGTVDVALGVLKPSGTFVPLRFKGVPCFHNPVMFAPIFYVYEFEETGTHTFYLNYSVSRSGGYYMYYSGGTPSMLTVVM